MNTPAHREARRHPLQWGSHPTKWRAVATILLLASLAGSGAKLANGETQENKKRPPELVIRGTVFSEKGFSLAGATIRVNRVGERKTRWEAMSDRRGEFGVRVPPGAVYEVHVKAKGYAEQTQKVDGQSSLYEDLVFRMSTGTGEKKP